MGTVKVKIQGNSAAEIGLTEAAIEKEVKDAVALARVISNNAMVRVSKILLTSKRKISVRLWEDDKIIKMFFGDSAPSNQQIKKVKNRLARVRKRLTEKDLVIRVRPRPSSGSMRKAQNLGTVFSPKRFKIYPSWFGNLNAEYDGNLKNEISSDSDLRRAAILVHELNHDLFSDQKLNGDTVYGEKLAKKLADAKPKSARRSSENMEWFCMRIQDPTGKL